MKKLLLVDGNSMLFRAYYATAYGARMTTRQGLPTNAVFGFANMMQKAIDLVNPDSILVAFDAGKHTFRHDLYPEYKGGRKPAPDDLVPQFQMVRDYLDGYHIKWVEMKDIEADDLIGTMSKEAGDYQTTILTSDHDLLQLVDESTRVLLMKKGLTDMDEMTPEKVEEEIGITPVQVIDLKGLMGDASDNYPGIPGVGQKTAVKLLKEYGSVENVLAHENEIKGTLGKKVKEGHDSALLSKQLATIKRDVTLDLKPEDCSFQPDYKGLVSFLESVDMKTLAGKYTDKVSAEATSEVSEEKTVSFETVSVCPINLLQEKLSVYVEEDHQPFYKASAYGMAFSNGKKSVWMHMDDVKKDASLLSYLKAENHQIIGFDIKRALHILKREGIEVHYTDDAMISAFLADSTLTSEDKIWQAYGLSTSVSYEDVYGTASRPKLPDPLQEAQHVCEKADNIYKLFDLSIQKIKKLNMEKLYHDMEMPVTFVLLEMEEEGIRCNADILHEIASDMKKQLEELQNKIYMRAGEVFNINSTRQLAEILYDKLQLPTGKKRSTSAEVLEKLRGFDPIIDDLLSYRKLSKIYSTYAEGLPKYIASDGKIHTVYNQCATQTGRLSSSDPNLQNISVRDEQGKIVRKAFLPEEGCVLLSSDYHQIELRMLASMANVPGMIEAFTKNIDVHTKTAMDLFGKDKPEDVTPQERRRAKTVNFGIVYGISDYGLAEQLGVPRSEAKLFIDTYYEKYPEIRTYMDKVVQDCEKNGYVTTLCGRRRDIPEIHDKNHMVREFGKRAAMNAPIQGSAADLIKIAMIHIDKAMKEKKVKSRMILQVHDELIFNVPEDEVEIMTKLVTDGMTQAMKLKVPLTVECSTGSDWYEAK